MSSTFGSVAIRLVLIGPLVGLWFVMHPAPGYACSCLAPGSPSEELAESAAVFLGKVVSVRTIDRVDGNWKRQDTLVEFSVRIVWQGPIWHTISLTTPWSETTCGYTFAEGVEYVVYSHNGASVSLCSRTRPLARAATDLAELGKGHEPAPNIPAATNRGEGDSGRVSAPGTPAPTPEAAVNLNELDEGRVTAQSTLAPTPADTTDQAGLGKGREPALGTGAPTPEASEDQTGGGCVQSRNATDLSAVGIMLGVVGLGLRKRDRNTLS